MTLKKKKDKLSRQIRARFKLDFGTSKKIAKKLVQDFTHVTADKAADYIDGAYLFYSLTDLPTRSFIAVTSNGSYHACQYYLHVIPHPKGDHTPADLRAKRKQLDDRIKLCLTSSAFDKGGA